MAGERFDDLNVISQKIQDAQPVEDVFEKETESGGAYHEIDDETGLPYWRLWGEGWMDDERMDAGEVITFDPKAFPPGTRIVVIEPGIEDPRSVKFYELLADKRDFYPLSDEMIDNLADVGADVL